MSNSRRAVALALVVTAALTGLAGCGKDRSGGPKGDPTEIVSGGPAKTEAAGTARVEVAIRAAVATGAADFVAKTASMQVKPVTASEPELRDPLVALDIVRAMASVRVYGGAEVRGASTIKYELDVAPTPDLVTRMGVGPKKGTFYADVFVDSLGRIRRVTVPIDPDEKRPSDTHKILAKVVTIDFYDFGA